MTAWHSLYLPFADPSQSLTDILKSHLAAEGYTLYDPFGIMPMTKAYPRTVRAFIAPVQNGWTRILLSPDTTLSDKGLKLPVPMPNGICFAVSLIEGEAQFTAYQDGILGEIVTALAPYVSADRLREALTMPIAQKASESTGMPLEALGGDVQAMAKVVNTKQAQKMFDKIAGQFLKGDQKAAARDLLSNAAVAWNSAGGRRIAAVMACLPITNWREPDYATLRDAYQLHNRKRRNPNATLYPGDQAAMDAVSNALDYMPLFAGKLD